MTAATAALTDTFREVMASVCTPVSVVTVMVDGRPHGTTVSAFASLSLRPPMVLVSLDAGSDLLAMARETERFGVNILGSDQSPLAMGFARKGSTKFDGVPWTVRHGLPRIGRAPGWLACDVQTFVNGGDHVVLLGSVVDAEVTDGMPLTYHARTFGTHTAARHPEP